MRILFGLLLCLLCTVPAFAEPQTFAFGSRCVYPQGEERYSPDLNAAVSYTATKDGRITEAKISLSSGIPAVDEAAVQCVLRWTFNADDPANAPLLGMHEVFVIWSARPFPFTAPRGLTPGMKIGKPHFCYPAASQARLAVFGKTTVGFQIKTNGRVGDLKILVTSGNPILDEAALKCAQTWRYKPAIENFEPVEVAWKADIIWNMDIQSVIGRLTECARSTPITFPDSPDIEGTTELSFIVLGSVESATITRTSGSQALDHAAAACLASRPNWDLFYPIETVTVITTDVPAQFTTRVNWRAALLGRQKT